MKVQPAIFAAFAILLMPMLACADDEQHSHGLRTAEVYLKRPVPLDKAVRIVQLDVEPRGVIERHCHSGDEIGIVTKGTLMLRVGDAGYEEKHQGDSFKVSPGTWMTVKNDTEEAAQLYSVLVVDDDGNWLKHDPKSCEKK